MLAGGSIIWLYHLNYKTHAPSVTNYQKEKANENKNQAIQKEKVAKDEDEGKNVKQNGITNSRQPDMPGSNNSETPGTIANKRYENKIGQTNLKATWSIKLSNVTKKIIPQNNMGISPTDKDINSSKKEPALTLERNDSAFQFSLKDSAGQIAQKAKKEISIKKRSKWLITVGGGITSTKEHGSSSLLDPDKSFDRLVGAANGPGNYASSSDSTYKIIKPENGFHFTAGIVYRYPLSNKWIISSGLQYRFLTNKQKAGKYIDSSGANYSSVNSGAQYYQAGYKNNITNKAHWFEIPLNIAFNINPAAKTKIQVSGGASYARMFADKWLIPDSRNNELYYGKELLNKNIFNWQTGTAITLSSGWIIGIQYEESISTVANQSVEPHLYWQNFSLHTAFPFQTKNHK
jgi:hypothetical protein